METLSLGMSRTSQTLIRAYILTSMSKNEKEQFQAQTALHYYALGTSFHQIEEMHLQAAIKLLHPNNNVMPSCRQCASTLLDKCHQELQNKVNVHMKVATSCLTSDVWSNIKNDFILIYVAVSKDCCQFLEFVSTEQQGHDHQFIAGDLSCIICHNTSSMFAGTVTDNTSTNN